MPCWTELHEGPERARSGSGTFPGVAACRISVDRMFSVWDTMHLLSSTMLIDVTDFSR